MATETVFVRGESGVIIETDIDLLDEDGQPTTHARERFNERIAAGAISLVEGTVIKVQNFDGSGYHWIEAPNDDTEDAPKRGRGKKADEATEEPAAE